MTIYFSLKLALKFDHTRIYIENDHGKNTTVIHFRTPTQSRRLHTNATPQRSS